MVPQGDGVVENATEAKEPPKTSLRNKILAVGFLGLLLGFGPLMDYVSAKGYDCDNLVSEIVALSDQNKNPLFGIRIIDIVEPKTLSTAADRVECQGTAIISNGSRGTVKYRAYTEYDKWWIASDPPSIL